MGIFDDEKPKLIQSADALEIVRRVSEDLFDAVKRNNIALEIVGSRIKLLGQSRTTLEINCEATNMFGLVDGPGDHPSRFLPYVASSTPRSSTSRHRCTQDEMATRVRTWVDEQRS
jgi:hypothetical protein